MPRTNPFLATVVELSPDDLALLSSAVAERRCREEVGFGTFAGAAALYRPDPPCPARKAKCAWRDGLTDAGVQRLPCHGCRTRLNSLTGTVLERGKPDMPTWVDFVRLMRLNAPIGAIAEVCRVSHQAGVPGVAPGGVGVAAPPVRGRRRLPGPPRPARQGVAGRDAPDRHGPHPRVRRGGQEGPLEAEGLRRRGGRRPQEPDRWGLRPREALLEEGQGRPREELAEGSTPVGGKERAHNALVKAVKGTHEAYKADAKDPVYLERVAMVNNLCSWIKRYLWRFTGMEMKYLQSYLNWHVHPFRVKQAREKWPEIARVVRHILMTEGHFRSSRMR